MACFEAPQQLMPAALRTLEDAHRKQLQMVGV
jgi:hypothetical protein